MSFLIEFTNFTPAFMDNVVGNFGVSRFYAESGFFIDWFLHDNEGY